MKIDEKKNKVYSDIRKKRIESELKYLVQERDGLAGDDSEMAERTLIYIKMQIDRLMAEKLA